MKEHKVFILLPDGVGFRNFANSGFYPLALQQGLDIVFWNNAPFPVADLGFPEVKINKKKLHPMTDIFKGAKTQIELNLSIKKANDRVYDSYRFPFLYNNTRNIVKNSLVNLIQWTHSSVSGLLRVRKVIKHLERTTAFYKDSLETLQKEKPEIVFCTNQRHITTIAPLLAAQDLGIPTATFIFSWDNLPKATLVVETDYYFVWSDHMKKELQYYYPYIQPEQIFVTGSPQFEMHFDPNKLKSREAFFKTYNLDTEKRYVCFTGNDEVSSPDDPEYLKDIAEAVRSLKKQGSKIGVIFRRCPVDFSNRYKAVLEAYSDEITAIEPLWKPISSAWNGILPTLEDDELLANIAEHSDMGITIGSSTIFDFISHGKLCGYLRYNQKQQLNPNWDIYRCYKYVHFRSMPSSEAVLWMDSPETIANVIADGLKNPDKTLQQAALWFETINQKPYDKASLRIVAAIRKGIHQHSNKLRS